MADVKISALPASTTPLAGTEVLPIVQSSTTRQVSVANLTAGRAVNALSITASSLTSGRVTYAGTAGLLQDNSSFTYGTGLTVNGISQVFQTGLFSTDGTLSNYSVSNGVYLNGNATGWSQLSGDGTRATFVRVWGSGASPANFIVLNTAGSERMRVDSSGNVGIGTSSPTKALDVYSSTQRNQIAMSGTNVVAIRWASTDPNANERNWEISNNIDGQGFLSFRVGASQAADPTTSRMTISSAGIVTMSAYGAGTATFSAAGVISSVSDETWKVKDGVPVNTDAMLQKLEPGYWFYNEEKAPTFGEERQLGFYAQNVHEAIGEEAAPTPQEGKPWGYHDRSVLAIAVMSLKNALNTIAELKQRIETLENK
jgi:hypothetical protein